MVILMIKSRFGNIGFDNSLSFDSKYMARMANRIIHAFKWDYSEYVGKDIEVVKRKEHSHLKINSLKLMLKWNPEDYKYAKKQSFMLDQDIVKPDDAADWIKNNVVGSITKEQLDYARYKEV